MYVVTFDNQPVYHPGMLAGLRRMSLSDARKLVARASRAHRSGVIVNADTLERA